MNYTPSVNIELGIGDEFNYIVTPNSQSVLGNIVSCYQSGVHSFTIIGTYGTGKSSFLLALERDLKNMGGSLVTNPDVFGSNGFEFLNIVGDYASLNSLLSAKLKSESKNVFASLNTICQRLKKDNKFLVIVVDEFGKILEHAANTNPEQELYFLQKLAEFVNVSTRKVLLLTTLHQNFSTYSNKLTETQKNEWSKVKGRFKEIVFVEPVEQLLFLTAEQLGDSVKNTQSDYETISTLLEVAKKYRIISPDIQVDTMTRLFPLDAISSACLTLGIQRYGQNERTLFSFLSSQDEKSISAFRFEKGITYNVAKVYDYLSYSFYSILNETNADSMEWRSMRVAIERVESGVIDQELIEGCLKLVKTIGILTLFFKQIRIDDNLLSLYAKYALGMENIEPFIKKLVSHKIIRFAAYKSQYILFEGTDIDIEDELFKASAVVPAPSITVEEISPYVKQKATLATANYYKTGTPRYFEYRVVNDPTEVSQPSGDIDGFINLVFPLSDIRQETISVSSSTETANIFVYFNNAYEIFCHLYEIKKLQYVLENVILEDRIAKREVELQLQHESLLLNESLNNNISAGNGSVTWFYKGKEQHIGSFKDINKLLSRVCDDVYSLTPIIHNELFNRQKLSSAISLARVNLLDAMLDHSIEKDFGINESAYPPEKTIYYTLFNDTGIHRQDNDGLYLLDEPLDDGIMPLWNASCDFLDSCIEKEQKLTVLIKKLKERPYKLKQGVIDFWVPIFLFIKQQNFALYNGNTYVLNINKEVFELIQKRPNDFSIKTFDVSGVKMQFFRKYRQFLRQDEEIGMTSDSVLATIKPFFNFYRRLNNYAKHTRKFNNQYTAKFRDILAEAKDPTKAFFEDLPIAFGYNSLENDSFVEQYVSLIRTAIHELNACYDNFIDRIETCIKEHIGIDKETDFEVYKTMIDKKYSSINKSLLTQKTKSFVERLLSPSNSKKEFYEKIGLVVYDRRLDSIKDHEEERFIYDLQYLFSEAERYISITNVFDENTETAFSFELASSKGDFKACQTYSLPKTKQDIANKVKVKLNKQLTGDNDLDICILLKMLSERL